MKPKAIDLFSGCGGLTLGLQRAGFDVVGAVEIDPLAAETYRANHSKVYLWRADIRRLTAPQILLTLNLRRGELDLLAGCPPCQGFSAIRKLNGGRRVRDGRNGLVLDFLRLVMGLRPKAIMMENVPALAANARFAKFRRSLARLGYSVNVDVKDARHYGVPQRRRRMIVLAGANGFIGFAPEQAALRTVRQTIGRLPKPGLSGDELHDMPEERSDRIRQLIARIPKDGGSRIDLPARYQLRCHRRCDGFKDVYGRMAWDKVAPTITGGCHNPSKGRFLHPDQNRAITLREAALLQGFPPRYRFPCGKKELTALQIGNALPPEFVRRHALQVFRFLRGVPASIDNR